MSITGLSSALLEHLREDYPLAYNITVSVAPFSFGETPLQHYNSLLCLSWLQSYTDAVLLFQNDSILEQVQSLFSIGKCSRVTKNKESVSIDDMNKHISNTLCNSFLPVWDVKQRWILWMYYYIIWWFYGYYHCTRCPHMSGREPWELIRSICPDPATKFITPLHIPFTKATISWDQMIAHLIHSKSLHKKHTISSSPVSKISTANILLVSRGSPSSVESLVRSISSYERKLKHTLNTVEWNPFPVDYWFSYEPHLAERKISTILVNSTAVTSYLDCLQESWCDVQGEGLCALVWEIWLWARHIQGSVWDSTMYNY